MSNDLLKQLAEHLTYAGYEVEEPAEGRVSAKHRSKLDFSLKVFRNGILLAATFATQTAEIEKDELAYKKLLNDMNRYLTVLRVYDRDHKQLVLEAWYPPHYDKREFAAFLDVLDADTGVLASDKFEMMKQFVK